MIPLSIAWRYEVFEGLERVGQDVGRGSFASFHGGHWELKKTILIGLVFHSVYGYQYGRR